MSNDETNTETLGFEAFGDWVKGRSDKELRFQRDRATRLAKFLAEEDVIVRHANVDTASFNVKSRELTLPIWQENIPEFLYNMLVAHEDGHALHTPADYQDKLRWMAAEILPEVQQHRKKRLTVDDIFPRLHDFWNVIEDARIDKIQKRRFPGLKHDYADGYAELHFRNFFGTRGRKLSSFKFLDRINILFKGGPKWIKFSDEERALLKRIEEQEDHDSETLPLTREIFLRALTEVVEPDEQEKTPEPKKKKSKQEQQGPPPTSTSSRQPDNMDDEDEEEKKPEDEPEKKGGGDSTDKKDEDELPEAETEGAWRENSKRLLDTGTAYEYRDLVDSLPVSKEIASWRTVLSNTKYAFNSLPEVEQRRLRKSLAAFREDLNASVQYLVSEFSRRKNAETYARTKTARMGTIDPSKLVYYKTADDIFKTIKRVSHGKNHGFQFLVDWSGSMQSNLDSTIKQLLLLTHFARHINVPFDVYSFTDGHHHLNPPYVSYGNRQKYVGFTGNVDLKHLLSSEMNSLEFNNAALYLWTMGQNQVGIDFTKSDKGRLLAEKRRFLGHSMGSTPLSSAMVLFSDKVNAFRARHKIEVVNAVIITDGAGTDNFQYGNMSEATGFEQTKVMLTDPQTKRTYDLGQMKTQTDATTRNSVYVEKRQSAEDVAMQIFSHRTGANVVGFYITQHAGYGAELKDMNEFQEKGSYVTPRVGYDEFYIVDVKAFFREIVDFESLPDSVTDFQRARFLERLQAQYSNRSTDMKKRKMLFDKFVARIVEQKA